MEKLGKFLIILGIIIVSVIAAIIINGKLEEIERIEAHKKLMREIDYNDLMSMIESMHMHEDYTNDIVIMSLFDNITAAYPFLQSQGKILFDCVPVLISNISIENYNLVNDQYQLCLLLDDAVVENRTRYFKRFEENYSDIIYYNNYSDVVYYDDSPASEHRTWGNDFCVLSNYTIDLKRIGMKLDFIRGIMAEAGIK